MNFNHAIVRTPCKNVVYGLTTQKTVCADYTKSIEQHENYIKLLEELGLNIDILSSEEKFPDSTFIEDTAVLTPYLAVLCNPGADSRKGEISSVRNFLKTKFSKIETIEGPGTLDGGDVLEINDQFYIGLSSRTDQNGAEQLLTILSKIGKTGSIIPIGEGLHLKSSVSYLGENYLLINSESINMSHFSKYECITTAFDEGYSANSISINGTVIMPDGFSKTKTKVENAGFIVKTLNVSEFKKLDGGLSCLSLRY